MKERKLYIKLFFVKIIVKNKDLKPAFKELSFFLDFYGSEIKWKCNKKNSISKSAGHFSVKCFLNGLYLRLLCRSIVEAKKKGKTIVCGDRYFK